MQIVKKNKHLILPLNWTDKDMEITFLNIEMYIANFIFILYSNGKLLIKNNYFRSSYKCSLCLVPVWRAITILKKDCQKVLHLVLYSPKQTDAKHCK